MLAKAVKKMQSKQVMIWKSMNTILIIASE